MLQIKTQQHKSISLRSLINSLQNGIAPQNVHHHQVFDFDKEPDFDSQIVDDFSDKLEVMESHRMIQEYISDKIDSYQKEKSKNSSDKTDSYQKEKSKNSKEPVAAKTPPVAAEPSQPSAEDN